ncbi:MAG: hypothetical protein ISR55_10820 [Bacteroidetes bacterium]|nr:hypothetical protein [Bacteroidota bacterium]MBL6964306.1 hypothetical protein [Bacteroidota bacterium]
MKKEKRKELERIIRKKKEQAIQLMNKGNISAYIRTLIEIEQSEKGIETQLAI